MLALGGVLALVCLGGTPRTGAQGLTQRPVVGPFLNNTFPQSIQGSPSGWTVVQAFPNLTFDDPVCLMAEPRTNRLYVCERQGRIYHFVNNPATSSKTLFLDRTPVTQGYDDCGMMGIAFHPEYGIPGSPNRGYVYVYYQFSENPTSGPGRPPSATPGFNRLSRFTVPDGSLVADSASELILINQFDRHVWHNGGGMFFGPDGFLYVSNGDEGAANDSYNQSQEINSGLFSGVLRIDVDQDPTRSHSIRRQPVSDTSPPAGWTNTTFSTNYYIPNDNPWQDPGGSILEEFFAVGLRSPHRMTFDPATGRIWLGDIGQGSREEVDIIEKGGNYQWAYREGNNNGPKAKPNPIIGVDKPPVHDYGRGAGDTCVIGGYVYRGSLHPTLFGKYIFGDNTSGRVWAMTYDGVNPTTVVELLDTGWPNNYQGLSSFGVDNDNELYLCKMGRPSRIYKLAPSGPPPPEPPALLSQTGAFTNLASLAAAPALIPYDIISPLWSDAAEKQRWLVVPNNGAPYGASETIGFSTNGSWSWPTGTVFVKHFALRTNETDPASLKRLETRFLIRSTNTGWYGITYKWRADQSDADLLPGADEEIVHVTTPTGVRTQLWAFPGRGDCLTCHNETADHVLGPRTCQMNGDMTYPQTSQVDNQINALNTVGFFNPVLDPASIASLPRAVPLNDTNASLETRVRSYLDSNCAHCHRPDGVSALFDARFDTPLGSQGLIDGPVVNPMGIDGARVIKPGNINQSLLHVRDSLVGLGQMPPLARNLAHQEYLDVLAAWIGSIAPPGAPPPPWVHQDIGGVGVPGDATYSGGTFTVEASGVDIWDQADSFHFVYQPLVGDVTVSARVAALDNTHPWAIGGVMIRQSLTAGSQHAIAALTPGNGVSFTRRLTSGAASVYTAGAGAAPPYWVRLVRAGNTLSAYQSSDGVAWTLVGADTVAMSGTVYVGLAWSAHDNGTLGAATFDSVTVATPYSNQPPTITGITNQTTLEDTPLGPVAFNIGDVETASDDLTLSVTSSVPVVVPVGNIVLGGSASNRTVTVTPALNQHGTTDITLEVSDGTNSASRLFALTVLPVNDAPVPTADTVTRWPDQGVKVEAGELVANDTDVEGDPISLLSAGPVSAAGGSVSQQGLWVHYQPPVGFHSNDTFLYRIVDGQGGTNDGTVSVAVNLDPAPTENLQVSDVGDGTLRIRGRGVPLQTYHIQYSDSQPAPIWQVLASVQADASGAFEHLDAPPTNSPPRVYRTVQPANP